MRSHFHTAPTAPTKHLREEPPAPLQTPGTIPIGVCVGDMPPPPQQQAFREAALVPRSQAGGLQPHLEEGGGGRPLAR